MRVDNVGSSHRGAPDRVEKSRPYSKQHPGDRNNHDDIRQTFQNSKLHYQFFEAVVPSLIAQKERLATASVTCIYFNAWGPHLMSQSTSQANISVKISSVDSAAFHGSIEMVQRITELNELDWS